MTAKTRLFPKSLWDSATPGAQRAINDIYNSIKSFKEVVGFWFGGDNTKARKYGKMIRKAIADNHEEVFERTIQYIETVEGLREALLDAVNMADLSSKMLAYLLKDGQNSSAYEDLDLSKLDNLTGVFAHFQDHFTEKKDKLLDILIDNDGYVFVSDVLTMSWLSKYSEGEMTPTQEQEIKRTATRIEDLVMDDQKWRNGEDKTSDQLADQFSLRGANFGNYTGSKHQQLSVNYSFDSFMDICDLTGMPLRSIRCGPDQNALAIGFGTSGHGGKNAPAAFFMTAHNLINLTKHKGDGTLSHEWAHAFSLILGYKWRHRIDENRDIKTYQPNVYGDFTDFLRLTYDITNIQQELESILRFARGKRMKANERKEVARNMLKGWAGMFTTKTRYYKDALYHDGGVDRKYFSQPDELFARAFEAYVADNLGRDNPFLVNKEFVSEGFIEQRYNWGHGWYPKGHERQRIHEAFRHLFGNIVVDQDGIARVKEGYQLLVEKEKAEIQKTVDELAARLDDIFNALFMGEKSPDGKYWYAFKMVQRGPRMQPDGFTAYDDRFNPADIDDAFTGTGAVAYNEPLSADMVVDFDLEPITHGQTDSTIYLDQRGEEDADTQERDDGDMGGEETPDDEVSEGEGDIGEGGGGNRGPTGGGNRGDDRPPGGNTGSGGRVGDSGDIEDSQREGDEETPDGDVEPPTTRLDYTLTETDLPTHVSPAQSFNNAIAAIRTLKVIEAEGRMATAEEQAILANMPGWGTIADAVQPYPSNEWRARAEMLEEELTVDELYEARTATDTSYFTPLVGANFMWDVIRRLGFDGGRVLEAATGNGVFFGTMPVEMRRNSSMHGVEKNGILSRIARQLYQSASIATGLFEKQSYPPDFFDLFITNVPFSNNLRPVDETYNRSRFNLHDYYINRALMQIRPGGIVAVITSSGTMDKMNDDARQEFAQNGELIGAVRLPMVAHKAASNSSVTADILFFRRKSPKAAKFEKVNWLSSKARVFNIDGYDNELSYNEYFQDHPEMIAGTQTGTRGRYGGYEMQTHGTYEEMTTRLSEIQDLFPRNVYLPAATATETLNPLDAMVLPDDVKDQNYFFDENGDLCFNNHGDVVKLTTEGLKGKALENRQYGIKMLSQYVKVRAAFRNLIRVHGENTFGSRKGMDGSEYIIQAQKELSDAYDRFVSEFGFLNEPKNAKILYADVDAGFILGLEEWDPDAGTATKRPIFTMPELFQQSAPPDHVDSVQDAMTISQNFLLRMDIPFMAKLTGKSQETVISELRGQIYDDPTSGWVLADDYLSGNVRQKLKIAEMAAQSDKKYQENVDALKSVLPKDKTHDKIIVKPGAVWVDPDEYVSFTEHLAGRRLRNLEIKLLKELGRWDISIKGDTRWVSGKGERESKADRDRKNSEYNRALDRYSLSTFEIEGISPSGRRWERTVRVRGGGYFELLEHALVGSVPSIKVPLLDEEGNSVTQMNAKGEVSLVYTKNDRATIVAISRIEQINADFVRWLWSDHRRIEKYTKRYNEMFRSIVHRRKDPSPLPLPGKSPIVELNPHQNAAVRRYLRDGTIYLAHEVGAGKTYSMVASIMESRRLGLARRPVMACLKSTIPQIQAQFLKLYPGANLLVVRMPENAEQRKRVMMQIQSGNWDCIIMSHESFAKVPVGTEVSRSYLMEELRRLIAAHEAEERAGHSGSQKFVKYLAARINKLREKLQALELTRDEGIPTFEELGIDMIVVDEAHKYKNLAIATKLSNVRGLSTADADIAQDLHIKTQYLLQNNRRGVIFASGSSITNSISELYNISKYLQPQALTERGLESFDLWANTFGKTKRTYEYSPEGGGYIPKSSFTFTSIQEMMFMVNQVMDIVKFEETGMKRPPIKGGKPVMIEVEMDEMTKQLYAYIKQRAVVVRRDPKNASYLFRPDILFRVMNDSRNLTMDPRLYYHKLQDAHGSKINAVADQVFKVYQQKVPAHNHETNEAYTEEKGVQLVFIDRGVPGQTKNFDTYSEIKRKLIEKGVPEREIIMLTADLKLEERSAIYRKINRGDYRVVIGGTQTLGTGVNVQERIMAIHNADIGWTFEGYEQRLGRGLRFGNRIDEVEVFNYGTKETIDAYMWGIVAAKGNIIGQVINSNPEIETAEDIALDENTMTASEAAVAFSGDQEMKRKQDAENRLMELTAQLSAHNAEQAEANRVLLSHPGMIKSREESRDRSNATAAFLRNNVTTLQMGGKVFLLRNPKSKLKDRLKEAINAPEIQQNIAEAVKKGRPYVTVLGKLGTYGKIDWTSGRQSSPTRGGTKAQWEIRAETDKSLTGPPEHQWRREGFRQAADMRIYLRYEPSGIYNDTSIGLNAGPNVSRLKKSDSKFFIGIRGLQDAGQYVSVDKLVDYSDSFSMSLLITNVIKAIEAQGDNNHEAAIKLSDELAKAKKVSEQVFPHFDEIARLRHEIATLEGVLRDRQQEREEELLRSGGGLSLSDLFPGDFSNLFMWQYGDYRPQQVVELFNLNKFTKAFWYGVEGMNSDGEEIMRWGIAELTSGMDLTNGSYDRRKDALRAAKAFVKEKGGKKGFTAWVAERIAEHGGPSPSAKASDADYIPPQTLHPAISHAEDEADISIEGSDDIDHAFSAVSAESLPKGKTVKGSTVQEVQDHIRPIASKLGVNVVVVKNTDELKKHSRTVHRAAKNKEALGMVVRGMFTTSTKTVYLVADGLPTKAVAGKVFIHEVVGHYGLQKLLGNELNNFLDFIAGEERYIPEIAKLAAERKMDISTPEGRRLAVAEWFAESVENDRVSPSLWTKFVTMVRNALRKMGFKVSFSDAELAELVREAYRAAEEPGEYGAGLIGGDSGIKALAPQFSYVGQSAALEPGESVDWFAGPYDGKMRRYIDDSNAKLENWDSVPVQDFDAWTVLMKSTLPSLASALNHPELFKAYPQLKNVRIFKRLMQPHQLAAFAREENIIMVNSTLSEDVVLSTLMHEIQHWIQREEGFARGAQPSIVHVVENFEKVSKFVKDRGSIPLKDDLKRLEKDKERIEQLIKAYRAANAFISGRLIEIDTLIEAKYYEIGDLQIKVKHHNEAFQERPDESMEEAMRRYTQHLEGVGEYENQIKRLRQEISALQIEYKEGKSKANRQIKQLEKAVAKYHQKYGNLAHTAYSLLAGEIEARDTGKRFSIQKTVDSRKKLVEIARALLHVTRKLDQGGMNQKDFERSIQILENGAGKVRALVATGGVMDEYKQLMAAGAIRDVSDFYRYIVQNQESFTATAAPLMMEGIDPEYAITIIEVDPVTSRLIAKSATTTEALDNHGISFSQYEEMPKEDMLFSAIPENTLAPEVKDIIEGHIKTRERKPDTSLFGRFLSVPLYYFRDVPQLRRMLDIGLRWMDDKHRLFSEMVAGKTTSAAPLTNQMGQFKKDRAEEYKKVSGYLVRMDERIGSGYKVNLNLDEKGATGYRLYGPNDTWKSGVFETEEEAWEKAREWEADRYQQRTGCSDQAREYLVNFRTIADRMFNRRYAAMRKILEEAEANKRPAPRIVWRDKDGKKIHIDMQAAMAQMGILRGTYFPRERRPGKYVMTAHKKGHPSVLEMFDVAVDFDDKKNTFKDRIKKNLPLPINLRMKELKEKGYEVGFDLSEKLPESVYVELAGQHIALSKLVEKTLSGVTKGMKNKLSDIGLHGRWANGDYILTGNLKPDAIKALRAVGGQYNWVRTKRKGTPQIVFKNANKSVTAMVRDVVFESEYIDRDADLIFAEEFMQELADVLRQRGGQSNMMARSDILWKGYEEDPNLAITKSARKLAGSESKRRMAVEMVRVITGREESWMQYRDRMAASGEDADYNEYLKQVNQRKIDPRSNAYKEAMVYMKDMLRNDEQVDRVIGALGGAAVMKYLWGRVFSSPLANLTALPTSAAATMKGAGIRLRDTYGLLIRAGLAYRRYKHGNRDNMNDWERRALDHIIESGWDEAQYNHEALAQLKAKVTQTKDKILDLGMAAFSATERMNRAATILGTYMGLKEKHQGQWTHTDHINALNRAKEVSDFAHGVYGKANTPYLTRGTDIGAQVFKAGFMFKVFGHNYMLNMARLAKDKQWTAAGYMLLAPGVLAGAGASLAMVPLTMIGAALGYDDPEESFYEWLGDLFGSEAEHFGRAGIIGLGGYGPTLKGSIEIAVTDIPTSFKDLVGAPGAVLMDVWEGGENLLKGNTAKGFEKVLPTSMGSVIRSWRESTEGATTKTNTPLFWGREQIKLNSVGEIMMRALGFQPARIAAMHEKQWSEKQLDMKYREKRGEIYDRLVKFYMQPVFQRNQVDYAEILEEIQAYNETVGELTTVQGIPEITQKMVQINVKRRLKPPKRERLRTEED